VFSRWGGFHIRPHFFPLGLASARQLPGGGATIYEIIILSICETECVLNNKITENFNRHGKPIAAALGRAFSAREIHIFDGDGGNSMLVPKVGLQGSGCRIFSVHRRQRTEGTAARNEKRAVFRDHPFLCHAVVDMVRGLKIDSLVLGVHVEIEEKITAVVIRRCVKIDTKGNAITVFFQNGANVFGFLLGLIPEIAVKIRFRGIIADAPVRL